MSKLAFLGSLAGHFNATRNAKFGSVSLAGPRDSFAAGARKWLILANLAYPQINLTGPRDPQINILIQ
jgi:hypothetical protein